MVGLRDGRPGLASDLRNLVHVQGASEITLILSPHAAAALAMDLDWCASSTGVDRGWSADKVTGCIHTKERREGQ
jgi:hypothetical protein